MRGARRPRLVVRRSHDAFHGRAAPQRDLLRGGVPARRGRALEPGAPGAGTGRAACPRPRTFSCRSRSMRSSSTPASSGSCNGSISGASWSATRPTPRASRRPRANRGPRRACAPRSPRPSRSSALPPSGAGRRSRRLPSRFAALGGAGAAGSARRGHARAAAAGAAALGPGRGTAMVADHGNAAAAGRGRDGHRRRVRLRDRTSRRRSRAPLGDHGPALKGPALDAAGRRLMLRQMKTLARLSTAGLSRLPPRRARGRRRRSADDVAFLRKHTPVVVLTDGQGMRVAVAPDLQGRVMTSSARGDAGPELRLDQPRAASPRARATRTSTPTAARTASGSDRRAASSRSSSRRAIPSTSRIGTRRPPIDTEPYPVTVARGGPRHLPQGHDSHQLLGHAVRPRASIASCASCRAPQALKDLGPGRARSRCRSVAFESENRITNSGHAAVDGRRRASSRSGSSACSSRRRRRPSSCRSSPGRRATLGPIVNDAYFGKVPGRPPRGPRAACSSSAATASTAARSASRPRARVPVLGSYDASGRRAHARAVQPARGRARLRQLDVGDPEGAVRGRRREQLQRRAARARARSRSGRSTSSRPPRPRPPSPAGGSLVHRHRTIHLVGDKAALDAIARKALGASLDTITSALGAAK